MSTVITSDGMSGSVATMNGRSGDAALGGSAPYWVVKDGGANAGGGTAVCTSTGFGTRAHVIAFDGGSGWAEQRVSCIPVSDGGGGFAGVIGRMADATDLTGVVAYLLDAGGGNATVVLYEYVAGTPAYIADTTIAWSWGTDELALVCTGATAKAQKNGTDVLSGAIPTHTTGYSGVVFRFVGASLTNFKAEDIGDTYEPPESIEVLDTDEIVAAADGGDFPEFDATHVKGILVHIASYKDGPDPEVEDSEANANWEELTPRDGSEARDVWWWNPNPPTAANLVVSVTGSGIYASAQIIYLDGPRAMQVLAEAGSTTSLQPGPITPARDGCLVAAGAAGNNGFDDPISVDDGFTSAGEEEYENSVNEGGAAAYEIQTTAEEADPTFSVGGSPTSQASSLVVLGLVTYPDAPAQTGVGAAPLVIVLRLGAAGVGVGAAAGPMSMTPGAAALGAGAGNVAMALAGMAAATGAGAASATAALSGLVAGTGVGAGPVTAALVNVAAATGLDADYGVQEFSWTLPPAATGVGAAGPLQGGSTPPAGGGIGAGAPHLVLRLGPASVGVAAVQPRAAVRPGVAGVGVGTPDLIVSGIEVQFMGHSDVEELQSIDVEEIG